jgi:FPC/CPF motif-containing protein YcgG
MGGTGPAKESFSRDDLKIFFVRNCGRLTQAAETLDAQQTELGIRVRDAGKKLGELLPLLDSPSQLDLEDLERRLTILEERLSSALASLATEGLLLDIRRELDRQLSPYRRKMNASQLGDLERRYTRKRLFEAHGVPRLSLFYLT